jgi:hypothetical protein
VNPHEHRALREQLGAYALGGLTETETTAVRAHLDGCPDCRAELDELRPVAAALDGVAAESLDHTPVPPPWLADRIIERSRTLPRPTRGRPALLLAASVLVAALLGGGVGFIAGAGPQPPRESVAVRTVANVQADATVIPHTWGIEITLDADGFDPGTPYRVVVTDDTGRTVSAGEFVGTGSEPMVCNLNTSVLRAQATAFDVLAPDGSVVVHADL